MLEALEQLSTDAALRAQVLRQIDARGIAAGQDSAAPRAAEIVAAVCAPGRVSDGLTVDVRSRTIPAPAPYRPRRNAPRTELEVAMLDLTACPEPSCSSPAQVFDRSALQSTDGPIEHVRIRCLNRHHFLLPVDMLTSPHAVDVPDAAADALPSPPSD